ncbi:MAG: ATP-binding protein [Oceanicaulis sp.]|uniref:histidine kinase n=1 Tax=Maricaulis virginensis TaxID=144022 RepID=A0A9W6IK96_9PROT|nr:sensor histidine kinase [Maricaulis virginensis]MBI75128.1 ATP-binding protein [Oceanicaulis sp.]GLK50715.1 sensor histidine kinase [Maricaulis virginensis]
MTERRSSLAFRLFAGAAAWALVLLLLGAIALTTLYQRSILRTLDDRLTSVVGALVAAVEIDAAGDVLLARRPSDPAYGRVFSGRYWQILDDDGSADGGEVLAVSRSLWDEVLVPGNALLDRLRAEPGAVVTMDTKGPSGEPLRLTGQAVQLSDRPGLVVFMAAEDRRPADRDVRTFAITSGLMFLGFAAAIAAGVFFQVRIGLAPVLRMRDRVAEVREGQAERVDGSFPAELQPLADELNAMLDHSRELVERSRTHVGNLAHALKTPIAVLTNEARTSQGALADLVERQTGIMAEQVEHHLRRARAAAHAKAVGARTDIAPTVDDLVRTLDKINAARALTITADIPGELRFRGERQDLEEMVGNLMDNACKWARGTVRVSAERTDERTLAILIEDDGPGLDEGEAQSALQRGVRLDEKAPGSGLGLAIVSDLAHAYGGELTLSRSGLGGLSARIDLPATSR